MTPRRLLALACGAAAALLVLGAGALAVQQPPGGGPALLACVVSAPGLAWFSGALWCAA